MSDKDGQQEQSIPPEWMAMMAAAQGMPSQGFCGFPPVNPMMNPFMMNPAMQTDYAASAQQAEQLAQYQAMQSQALAAQCAQYKLMQEQAAAQYKMMQEQAAVAQAQYQAAMMAAAAQQEMATQATSQSAASSNDVSQNPFDDNPMMQQAQAMVDDAMGEENAGMFKELLGTLGMNDNDFWKGALVGAAAALILSNENVRGGIMNLVSGTGDMLKSGGASVKETASSVKDNVATGGEIFRDTYQAGKEGFKDSVQRHKASKTDDNSEAAEPDNNDE